MRYNYRIEPWCCDSPLSPGPTNSIHPSIKENKIPESRAVFEVSRVKKKSKTNCAMNIKLYPGPDAEYKFNFKLYSKCIVKNYLLIRRRLSSSRRREPISFFFCLNHPGQPEILLSFGSRLELTSTHPRWSKCGLGHPVSPHCGYYSSRSLEQAIGLIGQIVREFQL